LPPDRDSFDPLNGLDKSSPYEIIIFDSGMTIAGLMPARLQTGIKPVRKIAIANWVYLSERYGMGTGKYVCARTIHDGDMPTSGSRATVS